MKLGKLATRTEIIKSKRSFGDDSRATLRLLLRTLLTLFMVAARGEEKYKKIELKFHTSLSATLDVIVLRHGLKAFKIQRCVRSDYAAFRGGKPSRHYIEAAVSVLVVPARGNTSGRRARWRLRAKLWCESETSAKSSRQSARKAFEENPRGRRLRCRWLSQLDSLIGVSLTQQQKIERANFLFRLVVVEFDYDERATSSLCYRRQFSPRDLIMSAWQSIKVNFSECSRGI